MRSQSRRAPPRPSSRPVGQSAAPASRPATPSRFSASLPYIGLLLLPLVAYATVMRGHFIWDDDLLITANNFIKSPSGLLGIWTGAATPDYLPVTSTLFWLEWRLWGDFAPAYHIVNIILHAAAVILLWRLLLLWRIPGSWLAAAIFAIHPVAVASVAWIAEGKNTLSLLLALCSLHLYFRSFQAPARSTLPLLALLAFLAALLSKSAIVMLPAVILLALWWRHGRVERPHILRLIPWFILSAIFSVVTIYFQSSRAIAGAAISIGGPIARLQSAAIATSFYLAKALLPFHLAIIYQPLAGSLRSIALIAGIAFWLAIFILASRHTHPAARAALFGLGAFGILLLPVLGLVRMYYFLFAPFADHLEYVALPPIIALVVAGFATLTSSPRLRRLRIGLSAGAIALLLFLTSTQASLYSSSHSLWTYAASVSPSSFAVHYAFAADLAASGQPLQAAREYELALKFNPSFLKARLNYAILLDQLQRFDQAISQYNIAIQLLPAFADSHLGLGITLLHQGRLQDAAAALRQAISLDPSNPIAHNDLALALQSSGDTAAAIVEFNSAIHLSPAYADPIGNLGLLYASSGDYPSAIRQLNAYIQLCPNSPDAHSNLGSALYMAHHRDEAIAQFQQALRLDPLNANARQNLSRILSAP